MNSDYRISITWRGSLKRKKLQRKLGAAGVLAVMDLWAAAAAERPDGILRDWDQDDVEIQAGWQGPPGELLAALTELSLLDFDGKTNTYSVHDWADWNGWAAGAEQRSAAARAAARARWNRPPAPADDGNFPRMPPACGGHANSNAEGMQNAMQGDASRNAPYHYHHPTLPLHFPTTTTPPSQEQKPGSGDQKNGNGQDQTPTPGNEVEEYIFLIGFYGRPGGKKPDSPAAYRTKARRRIMNEQGGQLSEWDREQLCRWRKLWTRKQAAAREDAARVAAENAPAGREATEENRKEVQERDRPGMNQLRAQIF